MGMQRIAVLLQSKQTPVLAGLQGSNKLKAAVTIASIVRVECTTMLNR